jgi:hypothetical protein
MLFFRMYENVYQLYALSRKCLITVRFTGHSKIVGPQFGTCLMTPILCVEFGGDFLKFGGPLISAVYNCHEGFTCKIC